MKVFVLEIGADIGAVFDSFDKCKAEALSLAKERGGTVEDEGHSVYAMTSMGWCMEEYRIIEREVL